MNESSNHPAPQVSVIVPYFQRKTGILARAVRSIGAQTPSRPIEVVIVDDSSPVPADHEVDGLAIPSHVRLKVVRRSNGGPAAARNHGLEMRDPRAKAIAYLDSDDEWRPNHLARALSTLAAGASFYFANLYHLDQTVGAFERGGKLHLDTHRPIRELDAAYFFVGDMKSQILTGNLIGTSTVVIDAERHGAIRFREEYYSAGEDYLCWLDHAQAGATFGFSTAIEAVYGHGVNVYSGAQWGTDAHLVRTGNEIRYLKAARAMYSLEPHVRHHVVRRIASLRENYVRSALARTRMCGAFPWRITIQQVAADPALPLLGLMGVVSAKARRSSKA